MKKILTLSLSGHWTRQNPHGLFIIRYSTVNILQVVNKCFSLKRVTETRLCTSHNCPCLQVYKTHTHTNLLSFHLAKWAVVIDLWICALFFSFHLSEIMYGSNLATDILENLFEIISVEATAVCLLRGEDQSIIVCSLVKHSITAITLDWAYSQQVPWPLEDRAVNVPFYFRGYVTCITDLYHDTAILSKQMDNGVTSKKPCFIEFRAYCLDRGLCWTHPQAFFSLISLILPVLDLIILVWRKKMWL